MKKISIVTLLGLMVLLVFTNPSKNDFDSYISTHINEYAIQSGEDDQTANLISGFSYLLLQSNPGILHRTNYLLFTLYKLDNDIKKQKEIMNLIPDIRKYFSFNNLKAVGEPERIKRPWLSIIKQLTKKHYTLTNKHYRIYKDDGKVIRTMNYTFTKNG